MRLINFSIFRYCYISETLNRWIWIRINLTNGLHGINFCIDLKVIQFFSNTFLFHERSGELFGYHDKTFKCFLL